MTSKKRATIYFDSDIHRALRVKAAETEQSISDVVDEAVRALLADDEADLAAVTAAVKEPRVSYESVLKELKDEGRL